MGMGPHMPRRSRAHLFSAILLIGCAPRTGEPVAPTADDQAARQKLIDEIMPRCELGRLRPLIGRPLTDALQEQAQRLSGLMTVRVRRPGQPYTQDLRTDRLNIDVDEAGRVVRFICE